MLAAGKAVDPFWRVYQQHLSRGNATKLLERMQIGILDPADVVAAKPGDDDDPYASDPERHPGLVFHNVKPCNAELPPDLILDNWITPNAFWFIRHHHPVPVLDATSTRIDIKGLGVKHLTLDLNDLIHRFTSAEVVCTIQCGGNRRGEFDKLEETSGISWGPGAMSTARFKGALLRDVLIFGGLLTPQTAERDGVKHIVFEGADGMEASIPVHKALSPYVDVLLAYEMNGEPLPTEHGAPVRAVVPGTVGVRNVKWIKGIRASAGEAEGPWQRGIAYKGFSPAVKSLEDFDEEAIAQILSIQEQPVTSVILEPSEGSTSELDEVTVRGFAWSGGGRGIARVDVSADGGKTWRTAELKEGSEQEPHKAWAWTFWEADMPLPEVGEFELCCKASDASYNTQPERPESIWNLRGLNNNSWSRVRIRRVE